MCQQRFLVFEPAFFSGVCVLPYPPGCSGAEAALLEHAACVVLCV